MYCFGGAEESKGGDDDAAATVAHAVKGGDSEEEEDVDASAALPHAVALRLTTGVSQRNKDSRPL
jgi:hypothetical protein